MWKVVCQLLPIESFCMYINENLSHAVGKELSRVLNFQVNDFYSRVFITGIFNWLAKKGNFVACFNNN